MSSGRARSKLQRLLRDLDLGVESPGETDGLLASTRHRGGDLDSHDSGQDDDDAGEDGDGCDTSSLGSSVYADVLVVGDTTRKGPQNTPE